MQSSSPLFQYPSAHTHTSNYRYPLHNTHRPLNSSPLASPSSPKSSPVAEAQARRRSQYKARAPSTPLPSNLTRTFSSKRAVSSSGGSVFWGGSGGGLEYGTPTPSTGDSHKTLLRERFKQRCYERAAKARAKAIRGRRFAGTSEASSDGFEEALMDEDDEEDDEDIMQDELFRRIMANTNRNRKHQYKVSYSLDVGSSFDPDMEDVASWEQELAELVPDDPHPPSSSGATSVLSVPLTEQLTPEDLDDEELAEYAEECARRKALEDFEGISEDDLFSWSDIEEQDDHRPSSNVGDADEAMDMT